MFSGFPSGHFSTSVYLNGPTGFSVSPCCSDYQSLNCSFAAMLPKKLPFAASADVSAEQSTPNLGLYVTIQYLHSYVQKSIPDQLRWWDFCLPAYVFLRSAQQVRRPTEQLRLYMKMYIFTSPYVRDVSFILVVWYTLSDPFRIPNLPQKGK